MPWERIDVDENFEESKMPTVQRVHSKVEDIHRTDLPGCPRHPTAGAIQQHMSWSDPDGTRHNRFVGIGTCADCGAQVMDPSLAQVQSIARSEYDR